MRNLIYTYSKPHLFRPLYISLLENGPSIWKYPSSFWQPVKRLSLQSDCSSVSKTNFHLNARALNKEYKFNCWKKAVRPAFRWISSKKNEVSTEVSQNTKVKPELTNPSKVFTMLSAFSEKIQSATKNPQSPRSIPLEEKTAVKNSSFILEKNRNDMYDMWNSFSPEGVRLNSVEGFNVRKLISRSVYPDTTWGRQNKFSFHVRPLGQFRSLLDIIDHNSKSISEPKIGLAEENRSYRKLKLLKLNAAGQNRKYAMEDKEKSKSQTSAPPPDANSLKQIGLKYLNLLRRKENPVKMEEKIKKSTAEEQTVMKQNVTTKTEQKKKNESDEKASAAENQSSSSYSNVFRQLFEEASRKTQKESTISAFNKWTEIVPKTAKNFTEAGSKSEKPHNDQTQESKQKSSVDLIKKKRRSQFNRPNMLSTSKSRAFFSTISKIPKETKIPSNKRPSPNLRLNKTRISTKVATDSEQQQPVHSDKFVSTIRKTHDKLKNNRIIKKIIYTSLDQEGRSQKDEVTAKHTPALNIEKNNRKNVRPKSSISVYGTVVKSTGPEETEDRQKVRKEVTTRREIHTASSVGTEDSLLEQVFSEVMLLCKPKDPSSKMTKEEKRLKKMADAYGRCSLEEKKKPEKKGLFCRIAGWFGIGCGRRRRPLQGCPDCRIK